MRSLKAWIGTHAEMHSRRIMSNKVEARKFTVFRPTVGFGMAA